MSLYVAGMRDDALDEPHVAEHAKEREKGERHQAMSVGTRYIADEVEDLGRSDAIELGAKLERAERIEERVVGDLALRRGDERIKETIGDAGEAQHAIGHLERLRESMAQDEKALFGPLWVIPWRTSLVRAASSGSTVSR